MWRCARLGAFSRTAFVMGSWSGLVRVHEGTCALFRAYCECGQLPTGLELQERRLSAEEERFMRDSTEKDDGQVLGFDLGEEAQEGRILHATRGH